MHYAEQRGDIIQLMRETRPSIEIFYAGKSPSQFGTVLIFPGGAYHSLSYDVEGTEIADWLNTIGFTAAILRYTVPTQSGNGPLADAQRALSLLKHNAAEWKITPDKIGTIGFSAGGHVAVRLGVEGNKRNYEAIDEADSRNLSHQFTALLYPAYLSSPQEVKLNGNITISDSVPPTFLVHPLDDEQYINSSLAYSEVLKDTNHNAEIHLLEEGGHGFGLRTGADTEIDNWPSWFEKWTKSILENP